MAKNKEWRYRTSVFRTCPPPTIDVQKRTGNHPLAGFMRPVLARMLLDHLQGILNYCRTKVPMGVIEAVNGNTKALLRRGRGYRDLNYRLLKSQRSAATKTEFLVLQKAA